jgi:hypothetical protein
VTLPTLLRRHWRLIWGLGISSVLVVAVGPYPVRAVVEHGELVHRLHDTVGSVQYLTLWAVPVLVWTVRPTRVDAWRLALATSVVVFGGAIWAGALWSSGSWLQLATLLVLLPTGTNERDWWRRWPRPRLPGAASVGLLVTVVIRDVPRLMDQQHIGAGDSHGLRFHYGGTGTAYLALLGAVVIVECWPMARSMVAVVAASCVLVGVANLVWPNYESALPSTDAWCVIASGLIVGRIALRPWLESRISWLAAGRSRSSSSHPRPTTPN